jgi:SAM-dependent methyltransferase
MSISSHNIEAIRRFGESNIDMDKDSPHNYVDARMGRLFTYLDLQYIKRWVLSEIDQSQLKNLSVLDVGAGKGRITRHLLAIANRLIVLEPFEPFFRVLLSLSIPPHANVEFYNCTLSQYQKTTNSQFDFIFVAGVTPYIDDDEINEFYNNLHYLVKKSGVILVRDYGIENNLAGDGPYGSIKKDLEIFRPPLGKMRIFKNNNLKCVKFRRAYPIIIPWSIYCKWPSRLTSALWKFASLNIFYPCYYKLAELNLPHRRESYFMYLLNPIDKQR